VLPLAVRASRAQLWQVRRGFATDLSNRSQTLIVSGPPTEPARNDRVAPRLTETEPECGGVRDRELAPRGSGRGCGAPGSQTAAWRRLGHRPTRGIATGITRGAACPQR
jgi:hypothetical protein